MTETVAASVRINDISLHFDVVKGSHQHRLIQKDGVWERHLSIFFAVNLPARPGQVFFDVGANIGYYTLIAAKAGARVVAFEPNPVVREILERNVAGEALAGVAVDPRIVAIGNQQLRLVVPDGFDEGSYARASELGDTDGTVSIDQYVEETGTAPTVIKCDAEGRDTDVLSGALESLARAKPVVVFEFQPPKIEALSATGPDQLFSRLQAIGYTPYLFRGHSGLAVARSDWAILRRMYDLAVETNDGGHWDVLLWPPKFKQLTQPFVLPA